MVVVGGRGPVGGGGLLMAAAACFVLLCRDAQRDEREHALAWRQVLEQALCWRPWTPGGVAAPGHAAREIAQNDRFEQPSFRRPLFGYR